MSEEPYRIEFPNGWSVDVHMRKGGAVYCRRWPPGVTTQSMWAGLMRMSEDRFDAQVAEHGGAVSGSVHAFPPELFHDAR